MPKMTLRTIPLVLGMALLLTPSVARAHAMAPSKSTKRGKKSKKKTKKNGRPAEQKEQPAQEEAADASPGAPTEDDSADDPQAPPAAGEPETPEGAEPEPGAESPPPEPVPEAPPAPRIDQAAVDELSGQARALQDALFKSRARAAALAANLFQSRVQVELSGNLERFYSVTEFVLTLDGAPVFQAEQGLGRPGAQLVDAYAAPGAHALTVSATLVARRDPTYRIRIEQLFTIVVPERSTVSSKLILRESGNMWTFARRKRGRYRLRIDLKSRAKSNDRGGRKRSGASVSASGGATK